MRNRPGKTLQLPSATCGLAEQVDVSNFTSGALDAFPARALITKERHSNDADNTDPILD